MHSLGKHLMKIKLFKYVAAGHDLSHWNSDMHKKLCICDGWCSKHEIFARRLLLNVFMFTLHYVWFEYVMFELYLLVFFLLKCFIFYLSFCCIIKMINSLGATSSFSDHFWNLNMWSVVCLRTLNYWNGVYAAGMMRCGWWCICELTSYLLSYLGYFQQAEKMIGWPKSTLSIFSHFDVCMLLSHVVLIEK